MLFDLFNPLLTMGAAILAGSASAMLSTRFAGGYIGLRVRVWIGLLAGFAGGFAVARVVRAVWGRLVPLA